MAGKHRGDAKASSSSPGRHRATRSQATTSSPPRETTSRMPPKTEYVYVGNEYQGTKESKPSKIDIVTNNVSVPQGLPQWLGNKSILAAAWLAAMVLVSFDEWHTHGILPRPARLWDTSIVYGLLALVGISDMLVPLVNALAVGYFIVLLWEYYQKSGQFSGAAGGPPSSANKPVRPKGP